jgi:hypothetical protein
MCQTPYSIVKRQNPLPRWVIWAFFIVLGCIANHSHAQNCTKNLALSKATPLDSSYLVSSSSRTRVIFKAEVIHVVDCTSFPLNTSVAPMSADVGLALARSTPEITSTAPLNAKVTFRLQCEFTGVCFDSTGINVIDAGDNPTSGIDGTLEIFYSGQDSQGQQCFNTIEVANFSVSGKAIATSPKIVASTTCQRLTMKLILTVQQTGVFYKSNVATIKWPSVENGNNFTFGVTTFSAQTRIVQPLTLNIQNGTCAVKLSNTLLSFGVLKPSQVNALANGGVAKTLPFSLDINNCVGTSLGKKKMLRWIFDDPKLDDFTRMENTPFGSAKGISAQIIADAKFDASGNAMASNIITNGEKYMASGKAADEQKLNYKVNIIRNSDAVVEGAFSSKATVVLDYL